VDSYVHYDFENGYLDSLTGIFCKRVFFDAIQYEARLFSVYEIKFFTFTDDDDEAEEPEYLYYEKPLKKLEVVYNLDNLTLIGDPLAVTAGAVLSKTQFADIFGYSLSEITNELIDAELLYHGAAELRYNYYSSDFSRSGSAAFSMNVCAVYDGEPSGENTVYFLNAFDDGYDYFQKNLSFRQFYVSLSPDWNANKDILLRLALPKHNDKYYIDNVGLEEYGFTDYTPYQHIINDADDYISKVGDLGTTLTVIMLAVSTVGVFLFARSSIKRNRYKIGVLKSLGAGNANIAVIFGLEILIIVIAGFLLSMLFSAYLTSAVNTTFTGDLKFHIVFFANSAINYLVTAFSALAMAAVSLAYPLASLFFKQPVNIIKHSDLKA
jgi:hypothetical protein